MKMNQREKKGMGGGRREEGGGRREEGRGEEGEERVAYVC